MCQRTRKGRRAFWSVTVRSRRRGRPNEGIGHEGGLARTNLGHRLVRNGSCETAQDAVWTTASEGRRKADPEKIVGETNVFKIFHRSIGERADLCCVHNFEVCSMRRWQNMREPCINGEIGHATHERKTRAS